MGPSFQLELSSLLSVISSSSLKAGRADLLLLQVTQLKLRHYDWINKILPIIFDLDHIFIEIAQLKAREARRMAVPFVAWDFNIGLPKLQIKNSLEKYEAAIEIESSELSKWTLIVPESWSCMFEIIDPCISNREIRPVKT